MKPIRATVACIGVCLFMLFNFGTAWAAESWVTDAKTGVKIGWTSDLYTLTVASWSGPAVDGKAQGKGNLDVTLLGADGKKMLAQGEVEMRSGLLDGRAVLKFSEGDSVDAIYKAGQREGQGLYKFADGKTYEGEFKNNNPNGYGVMKDATGKVIYAGSWKDGEQVNQLKADKVLGIPWGTTEEQARNIMLKRPNTKSYSFMNGKNSAGSRWQGYVGPFADFNDAEIWVYFYQEKMWQVVVSWGFKEDGVMERYTAVKQGLTERYGTPTSDTGKYLDSKTSWDLGGGYYVNVEVRKNTIVYIAGVDPALTVPFRVFVFYYNQATLDLIDKTAKPGGANKDY